MSCFRALFSTIFAHQKPKNRDSDALTEMGLECLNSKEIQDRPGYSALFGIPTYFQVLWAVCAISAGPAGHETTGTVHELKKF